MPVEDLAQQGETSVCNTYNTRAAQAGESQVSSVGNANHRAQNFCSQGKIIYEQWVYKF